MIAYTVQNVLPMVTQVAPDVHEKIVCVPHLKYVLHIGVRLSVSTMNFIFMRTSIQRLTQHLVRICWGEKPNMHTLTEPYPDQLIWVRDVFRDFQFQVIPRPRVSCFDSGMGVIWGISPSRDLYGLGQFPVQGEHFFNEAMACRYSVDFITLQFQQKKIRLILSVLSSNLSSS